MTRTRQAMPEWLHRHDHDPRSWNVTAGPIARGEAFTDLTSCRMQIPVGDDETSRCVRAHEMMHAKISPTSLWRPEGYEHLRHDVLVAAEEYRVNNLVRAAGFPVDRHLADGSERRSGERLGANGDWNGAVLTVVATSGTSGSRAVITGLRRTQPTWVPRLRSLERQMRSLWKRFTASGLDAIASTHPWGDATRGWRFTLDLAVLVHTHLEHDGVQSITDVGEIDCSATGARGSFARPIVVPLPLTPRGVGHLRASRRASPTGRHPRRLDRLLTDPHRRIFDQRVRRSGGVVVVDQSGSMRLTDDDIWAMIRAAPGCTVIGYSHEARSTTTPNMWILAENGHVTERVPRGNGGNGVDGPVLRFAASRRDRRDPLIWVCDGYVTDAFDDHHDALTQECAQLVTQHRIHQVPDVAGAIAALSRASRGIRLEMQAIGPVESARTHAGR